MKYLVLRTFRSFGKIQRKGTEIDAQDIRSPHLRMSEGLIVPVVTTSEVPEEAVSSFTVAAEQEQETPTPQPVIENKINLAAFIK